MRNNTSIKKKKKKKKEQKKKSVNPTFFKNVEVTGNTLVKGA